MASTAAITMEETQTVNGSMITTILNNSMMPLKFVPQVVTVVFGPTVLGVHLWKWTVLLEMGEDDYYKENIRACGTALQDASPPPAAPPYPTHTLQALPAQSRLPLRVPSSATPAT